MERVSSTAIVVGALLAAGGCGNTHQITGTWDFRSSLGDCRVTVESTNDGDPEETITGKVSGACPLTENKLFDGKVDQDSGHFSLYVQYRFQRIVGFEGKVADGNHWAQGRTWVTYGASVSEDTFTATKNAP